LNSSGFGCEVRTVLDGTLGFKLGSRVGTEPRTYIERKLEGELSFVTGHRTVIYRQSSEEDFSRNLILN